VGAVELARAAEALGAGELMLNCIDQDGTNQARDIPFKCHLVTGYGWSIESHLLHQCKFRVLSIGAIPAEANHDRSQLIALARQRNRSAEGGGESRTSQGFDIELVRAVSDAVSIPVIASSGAGCAAHFTEVFQQTKAAAALAAGIFHRQEVEILDVKRELDRQGIAARLA